MNTGTGHVRNPLANATRPEETDETAGVRGRTSYGDITIRRPVRQMGYRLGSVTYCRPDGVVHRT